MLVPATQSTGTCSSSSTRSTPMCAAPRAPPPLSTRPMRGRFGCVSAPFSAPFSWAAASGARHASRRPAAASCTARIVTGRVVPPRPPRVNACWSPPRDRRALPLLPGLHVALPAALAPLLPVVDVVPLLGRLRAADLLLLPRLQLLAEVARPGVDEERLAEV